MILKLSHCSLQLAFPGWGTNRRISVRVVLSDALSTWLAAVDDDCFEKFHFSCSRPGRVARN